MLRPSTGTASLRGKGGRGATRSSIETYRSDLAQKHDRRRLGSEPIQAEMK